MDALSFLKSEKKRREDIITRLLSEHNITASEAVMLLKVEYKVSIQRVEMSSGAKIVTGDDYETNTR